MSKIRIDTEQVRAAGRRLLSESNRMEQMGHELRRAIGSLDTWAWDGRSRSRAEPMLNRVQPESRRVTETLDDLGRTLMRIADTFELEDSNAARNLEGMPWVDFGLSGALASLGSIRTSNDAQYESLKDIKFKVDMFLEAGATSYDEFVKFMNSLGIVDEYVIEVFYYQDDAVEILSVSEEWSRWIVQIPNTTSLWDDFVGNLGLSSTANMGLGGAVLKRLPLIGLAVDMGLTTWDYSDEGLFSNPEYYAALTATAGLFVVGAGATALAAAGLATVGLPAGVAAVAAGVGWAFVSNWLEEPVTEALTPAFQWAGEQLDTAYQGAQDLAGDAVEWTSEAVDWTGDAIDDAAGWVSNQVGDLADSLTPNWSWI